MSGYLEGILVLLAVNIVYAYGAFLPLAAGQLNIGLAGFAAIGAYSSRQSTPGAGHLPFSLVLRSSTTTSSHCATPHRRWESTPTRCCPRSASRGTSSRR